MTARNWDRVRKEKLCLEHGTERLGEDHPPGGGAYSIYMNGLPERITLDSQSNGSPRQTNTTAQRVSEGVSLSLTMQFRTVESASRKTSELKGLSDVELRECREICQAAIQRINEQLFDRARTSAPYGRK